MTVHSHFKHCLYWHSVDPVVTVIYRLKFVLKIALGKDIEINWMKAAGDSACVKWNANDSVGFQLPALQ